MKIAGEIALSDEPGKTIKKWREIFGITQTELSEYIRISPSTISDYERDRRKSPGIKTIKRFVDALIKIDMSRGGQTIERLREEKETQQFFETHEFTSSILGSDFAKLIDATVVVNKEELSEKKVYGFTLIDSIKVILELPYKDFPKLYGAISERAFIFTDVSTGRSPMVVIRITPTKPSVVVLHALEEVDKLAIKIAEKERIPLLTTKLPLNNILETLKKI